MNILQISASDNIIGGASRVAMDLKFWLEKNGHHSPMFVGRKHTEIPNVYEIPKSSWRKALSYFFANDIDFFGTDYILETQEFKTADLVHCHNLHGWYFSLSTLQKMSKIKPVLWTLHDMWAITPHCAHAFGCGLKNGFYMCPSIKIYPQLLWDNSEFLQKRKRRVYENSRFALALPSKWLKDLSKPSVLGDKSSRLIYNGVDESIFYPKPKEALREKYGIPHEKKVLLFLTPADKDNLFKGYSYFKALAKKLERDKDIVFLCAGLEDEEMKNRTNVKFLPRTADKSVLAEYYSLSDLLLFTSLADNFPLVILEAMACGLPVLAFDVGGVKEAIGHKENGYIVKYKDEEDLEQGAKYLLNLSPEAHRAVCAANRAKVEKQYSLEIMSQNYLKFYQELISQQNV